MSPVRAGIDELVAHGEAKPTQPYIVLSHRAGGWPSTAKFPDVMRGEETQIVGALESMPGLRDNSLLVLPGTHSKWVTVQDGRVVSFTTFLTGELFATLSKHSILGRPALEAGQKDGDFSPSPEAWDAFDRGVQDRLAIIRRAVCLRCCFPLGRWCCPAVCPPTSSLDYLSGLLLGEELRSALAERQHGDGTALALIGESALCERYLRALALFDVPRCR